MQRYIKNSRSLFNLQNSFRLKLYLLQNLKKERFTCPICRYRGPFLDVNLSSGYRKHAQCPKCKALERHRIQHIVMSNIIKKVKTSKLKMLHIAPEPFFRDLFYKSFRRYETADLLMPDVDYHFDLIEIPFKDQTYDFIYASHVLEHVQEDNKAISEIHRVLKPEGIAILPVPVVAVKTVEYIKPNPFEFNHVRAPGYDYFERYDKYFSKVEIFSSKNLPYKYQLYIFEDRSCFPTAKSPLRPAMTGNKHIDFVPVCYA